MTAYERELDPIYDELMEEETQQRRWMKPLQWILDKLQIGQYVSANIANEIIDIFDRDPETRPELLKAITEGITGERKGSYEHILRDRLNVGQRKLFENAPEGTRRSELDWADVLGFIGDVLLDPLTYMGFGGATKGAKAAASAFADDAVRLTIRQLGDTASDLGKRFAGRLDDKALRRILSIADTNKGMSELRKLGGDLGRFIDFTYREAYQRGLHRTSQELAEEIGGEGLEALVGQYSKAGERFGARFAGREFFKHQGSRAISDSWENFARLFKGTPEQPTKLRSAIWGAFNRGPIGEIRRALGIRNPYQKYLRAMELEKGIETGRWASTDALHEALDPLKDLSDEQLDLLRKLYGQKESAAAERVALSQAAATANADQRAFMEALGGPEFISSGDEAVDIAAERLHDVVDAWHADEIRWAQALGENPADYREWYLPKSYRGTRGSNVRRPRQYTFDESMRREIELQKAMWNVDDEVARQLVEENVSGLSTDIREMFAERALVHGKARARHDIIEQFKEFGIDLRRADDAVAQALQRGGRKLEGLGLENIDEIPGYLFDEEVAKILRRTISVTGKDRNIFARGMAKFAGWWKGMVTATPGFHLRNHISNTMTQYSRHGARAFNFKEYMMSVAAVSHVLRGSSAKSFLADVGIDEGVLGKYLNMRIGNKTVRELAEEARHRGVISEATMGFEPMEITQKLARETQRQGRSTAGRAAERLRPRNQPVRSASRAVGNYIENIPRFQSFLIDYSDTFVDMAKFPRLSGDALTDALRKADATRLDYAAREAKKWFIDYSDLSDFEQKTLKNVIPFYTWLRRNLSNQISGIALYPDLYSRLPKIEDFLASEDPDYDPALIPEWLKERGAFPLRQQEDGTFLMAGLDFAHTGLNLIPLQWEEGRIFPRFTPDELKDTIINATAPWIRRLADWAIEPEQAYNFFYRSDLGPTSDAPYLMRLFASRPGAIPVVDGILRTFGFDNGAHMNEENGRLQIDSRMALVLEEMLPVLRQLEFLFYLPGGTIPGFEEALERFTKSEDDYEDAEQVFQLLSYYLGVKVSQQDLERERERIGRDIYYQAREELTEQRRQEPGAEQRRLDSSARTAASIRRLGG